MNMLTFKAAETEAPIRTVAVIGLGYIGLPTAAILATNGLDVIGVDVNPGTVTPSTTATCPLWNLTWVCHVAGAVSQGRLRAQLDTARRRCLHRGRAHPVHGGQVRRHVLHRRCCPGHRPEAARRRTGDPRVDVASRQHGPARRADPGTAAGPQPRRPRRQAEAATWRTARKGCCRAGS